MDERMNLASTTGDPAAQRVEGGLRLTAPGRGARKASEAPLVSYVTVVRNAAGTLARTLASVGAQTWGAVEHIVVDGQSGDGTLDVIRAHAAQIDYFVSEPDAGLYDALNKAVALAQGDLVCVLNADDWLTPDAAAIAAREFARASAARAEGEPLLILTSAWLHDGRRRKLWLPATLDAGGWLRCPKICHNGVYANRAALAAAGPYDLRFRIVADTKWLCSAFDAGVRTVTCAAPTVHYSAGGLSSNGRLHAQECARMVAVRFPQLLDAEVWTLVHAFYPWVGNLEPFAAQRPADLGGALRALLERHGGDAALVASARAAGLEAQLGHARRVRARRALDEQLRRGVLRAWYGARHAVGA